MSGGYTVGIYEKAFPEDLSMQEMLLLAKEAGYDFYEINIDRTDYRIARVYDPDYIRQLKQDMASSGLPIRSLGASALSTYTLGNADQEIERKAIDILTKTILFAEELGIRIIQIPACDVPKSEPRSEKTRARFFDNVARMVEFASSHAVLLGLENMENDFMNSIGKSMDLITSVSSPYFQLYPDAGNLTNAFDDDHALIRDDFGKGAGHYFAFHFKEVQPTRFGGLFYGDGRVDFPFMAKEAKAQGIRRYVMEYWYTGNEAWKEDLARARKLCDAWLE